ncbi:MAG: hypothetical protein A3G70_01040 [Planctomycetes bacterium RIFCSPLOWO2_12_FULL_39_13]|nr:MAG: hypothetical protein A3G70_01040 [Planctomycetes bacterium RIFCSPLOWO2_12_FULL_39_13]
MGPFDKPDYNKILPLFNFIFIYLLKKTQPLNDLCDAWPIFMFTTHNSCYKIKTELDTFGCFSTPQSHQGSFVIWRHCGYFWISDIEY